MPSIVRLPFRRSLVTLCAVVAALAADARHLAAQAWFYPSFQAPVIVDRDYTFGVVASHGADFLFQWRERIDADTHASLDVGLADPNGASNMKLLVGGNVARMLTRATEQQPLDLLFTAGAGLAGGGRADLLPVPGGG